MTRKTYCPELSAEDRKMIEEVKKELAELLRFHYFGTFEECKDEIAEPFEKEGKPENKDWTCAMGMMYSVRDDCCDKAMAAIEQGQEEQALEYLRIAARAKKVLTQVDDITDRMDSYGNIYESVLALNEARFRGYRKYPAQSF